MISVKRLGHATLTTPDLERQVDYYSEVVGLTVLEKSRERAFLATKSGLEAIELEPGRGWAEASGLPGRAGFRSRRTRCQARQGRSELERRSGISPGVAEAIVFLDDKGTEIDVYAEYVFAQEDRGLPASRR